MGSLQLNDIIFDIDPKSIRIEKKSYNHFWQTLRTRSSVKSKSGYATQDIYITLEFVDDVLQPAGGNVQSNGYRKLRDLVSQVRVTPFCYIENELIRSTILGDDNYSNMAAAVKQLEVFKSNEDTNVIQVRLHLCWFNYYPFTKTFTFKKYPFAPIEVRNPRDSEAWKLLYMAEQRRCEYQDVQFLDGVLKAEFNLYGSIPVRRYKNLSKEVETLRKLQSSLDEMSPNREGRATLQNVRDLVEKELGDAAWSQTLMREVLGDFTSYAWEQSSDELLKNLGKILQKSLSPTSKDYHYITDKYEWHTVLTGNSQKPVSIKSDPMAASDISKESDYGNNDLLLLEKTVKLDFGGESDLIIEGLSISFENILSMLPFVGYMYPSYQHIGSTDARVTVAFITTNQRAVQYLSSFYAAIDNQHIHYRLIPAGFRNLNITNDLINMCGLKGFLTEQLQIETVEGAPGTFRGVLELVDNPITEETQEQFTAEGGFVTTEARRKKLVEILEKNVEFDGSTNTQIKYQTIFHKLLKKGSADNKVIGGFKYSGTGQGKESLSKIVAGYTDKLNSLFAVMLEQIARNDIALAQNSNLDIKQIFLLTNQNIPGVERVQDALFSILDFSPNPGQKIIQRVENLGNPVAEFREIGKDPLSTTYRNSSGASQFSTVDDIKNFAKGSVQEWEAEQSLNKANETDQGADGFIKGPGMATRAFNNILLKISREIVQYLDSILMDTETLKLPEFEEIRKMMSDSSFIASVGCYPDFPLQEVKDILQDQKSPPWARTVSSLLQSLYDKTGLGNKNVGSVALLKPDFYFFDAQQDVLKSLVDSYTVERSKEAILKAQESMPGVQADWFKGVYESSLGTKKAEAIDDAAKKFEKVSLKPADKAEGEAKQGSDKDETARSGSYQETLNKSVNDFGVAPKTLTGQLAPAIISAQAGEPIVLNAFPEDADEHQQYMNHREEGMSLVSRPGHAAITQRYEIADCLERLPEHEYADPAPPDPDAVVIFHYPVDVAHRHVSCPFESKDPLHNSEDGHKGVDFASSTCLGAPVYATADGWIHSITKNYETYGDKFYGGAVEASLKAKAERNKTVYTPKPYDTGAVTIEIRHDDGSISVYKHLQWEEDPDLRQLSIDFYLAKEQGENLESSRFKVRALESIGYIGNTGYSTGPHLHFGIRKSGRYVDPVKEIKGENYKSLGPVRGIDPQNDSLFSKSLEQFEKELYSGQGYGMIRAYPAFKLFFIESDMGERRKFAFDDFFSYAAVKEIMVLRSRKIPADLCILQLTNVSGALTNRRFYDKVDPSMYSFDKNGNELKEDEKNPTLVNTIRENPIASIMLQAGTQIQLRLGYSNDFQELEPVFNGVVMDVELNESGDLLNIICQSFAIELAQRVQTEPEEKGGWFSRAGKTHIILEDLLAFPEVVHFGRWELGTKPTNSAYGILRSRWNPIPSPQDDNIFAPEAAASRSVFQWLYEKVQGSTKYIMFNTTAWDVIQEMTLRHPGFIASAVPYEDLAGPRMTLFFGLPHGLYFARDPRPGEETVMSKLKDVTEKGVADDLNAIVAGSLLDAHVDIEVEKYASAMNSQSVGKIAKAQEEFLQRVAKKYALNRGFIKPFRSYHLLTSDMHILSNGIHSSAGDIFNTVTVEFSQKNAGVDQDSGSVSFGKLDTLTLKADAAIPDEECREAVYQYPNCVGDEQSRMYAVSLLFNTMKEAYSGTLITIGLPGVKPYDIVNIADKYNDMFGPIEVEQVVHRFSQETGFITEITPDLIVTVNQHATMGTADAMGLMSEALMKQMGVGDTGVQIASGLVGALSLAGTLATLPTTFIPLWAAMSNRSEATISKSPESLWAYSPMGALGVFCFKKLVTRTQLAHPFTFSPLVMNGKPMIGGLPNRTIHGEFTQQVGKWFRDLGENAPAMMDDFYLQVNPREWFGHSRGKLPGFTSGGG